MQIQSGRFYETREGAKVGPAVRRGHDTYPWKVGESSYTDDGQFFSGGPSRHHLDLVAECAESAAARTAATTFKVGDRVRYNCGYEAFNDPHVKGLLGTVTRCRGLTTEVEWDSSYIRPAYAVYTANLELASPVLKIEVGKSYTDADGKVIGPMFACGNSFAAIRGNGQSWRADGRVNGRIGDPKPLVAEYVAAPPTVPPADDTRSAILAAIEEYGERAWSDNLLPAEFQPPVVVRLMRAAGL